jgi:hypothetical protein
VTEDTKAKVAAVAAVGRDATSDNWTKRRRVMHWALAYIGAHLAWLQLVSQHDAFDTQIAMALVAGGFGIIGSYVFGAVWDDKNKRTALVDAAAPPPEE